MFFKQLNGKKNQRRIFVVSSLALAFILMPSVKARDKSPSNSTATTMSLKDSIFYALKNSLDLKVAQNELEGQKLLTKNSFTNFLPKVELSSSYNASKDLSESGSKLNRKANASVGISQSIYDRDDFFNYKKSKLELELAEVVYQHTRQEIVFNVLTAYYDYLEAIETEHDIKSKLKGIQSQFIKTESSYKQGLSKRSNFLSIKAKKKSTELELIRKEQQTRNSKNRLKSLLGMEVSASVEFLKTPVTDSVLKDIPKKELDWKDSFSYKRSILDRKIQNSIYKNTAADKWPKIIANARIDYDTHDFTEKYDKDNNRNDLSVRTTLGVSYTLLDWGTQKREIRIALLEKSSKELQIKKDAFKAKENAEKIFLDLTVNRKSYEVNKLRQEAEKSKFANTLREFQSGKVGFTDYKDSVDSLAEANTNIISTFYTLQKNIAEYHHFKGTLYDWAIRL